MYKMLKLSPRKKHLIFSRKQFIMLYHVTAQNASKKIGVCQMFYVSTRGGAQPVRSTRAVLEGIAPDGGLYMPEKMPQADWKHIISLPVLQMAEEIFRIFLPDFADIPGIVRRAYTGKFETEDLTPLVKVGDRYVLELFRGPTSAFKDVALSALPQLMVAARRQEGLTDNVMILTATSGDTGKAALCGFQDVEGIGIIVFYPDCGVSAVQKAQMVTQEGENVCVCAVKGNFDDAQTGVKKIFAAAEKENLLSGKKTVLSSANSINIGRLVPQIIYYFKAYSELVKQKQIKVGDFVDFTVPTGNFGNILAGFLAKSLGLPVRRLLCASNANNVLTDFIGTGRYDRNRPFYKTASPSMDILVSSNLERLLYLLSGCDGNLTAEKMQSLNETGAYEISGELLQKVQQTFLAGCCDDEKTAETIGMVWKKYGYLCDTHTAVAFRVSEELDDGACPNVVLSTASPYKFPASVVKGLGETPLEDEFAVMEQLQALTGVPVPKNLQGLNEKTTRHTDVVAADEMLNYVLKAVK